MAQTTLDREYIASIYPGKLETKIINVGPSSRVDSKEGFAHRYELAPCKRPSDPVVLEVTDMYERIFQPAESTETGRRTWITKIVPCEDIVKSLLSWWAGNRVGLPAGMNPGIRKIVNTTPTVKELDGMKGDLAAFFQYLFNEGERHSRENNVKYITEEMRLAAAWLGHERVWSNPEIAGRTVACPLCTESVNSEAAICKHCGCRLKAVPEHLLALNPQLRESVVGLRPGLSLPK